MYLALLGCQRIRVREGTYGDVDWENQSNYIRIP